MLDANWDEIPQAPPSHEPAEAGESRVAARWEDGLTFLLATVAFMSVAASVDSADWVRGLPSLYPIGFSALIIGYGLSRIRWNQFLLYPLGLFAGANVIFFQTMALINGHSLWVRTDHLLDRLYVWWSAVTQNGLSTDALPVIVIMLVLTWVGSFFSAWAIFRWRNPILGLIPGATALIWDTSFNPGQFSVAVVVYVFAAVLLVMRMYVAKRERQWRGASVAYPEFISVSVLGATFLVTGLLLASGWLVPLGSESRAANDRWGVLTSPISDHLSVVARAFISINPNKAVKIHSLKDALAFQGAINPGSGAAAQVDAQLPAYVAPFLREQSLNRYTRDGWRVDGESDAPLAAGDTSLVDDVSAAPTPGAPAAQPPRQAVTVRVQVAGGNGDHLFSLGQPLQSDRAASASIGKVWPDASSLKPTAHLDSGDTYTVTGSVPAATIEQLRAAGTAYPSWVTQTYLGLSHRLPGRVHDKAQEVAGDASNPYDTATAIEDYLRAFPIDNGVEGAPSGRDSVDYFLFDSQRGYFDYHASAMAVMLRTLGIPARIATGYVIDPLRHQGETSSFKLTQRQAFAWPEVFFPGIGWVEFNPTPSQPPLTRPTATEAAAAVGQPVAAPDAAAAADTSIRSTPEFPLPGVPHVLRDGARHWRLAALVAIAVLALGAVSAAAFAWELSLRGLPRPARLWEKTLRLARLGDARLESHETPREFADRLHRAVPDAAGVSYIAATYERVRFGQKRLSHDEARRLEAAWSAARGGLLRRALRLRSRRSGG